MTDQGWASIPPDLLTATLEWRVDLDNPYVFHALLGAVKWTLQVNDFPEEIMFTLLRAGELVARFDERPPGWHMRRER